jgi:hypothetical protein
MKGFMNKALTGIVLVGGLASVGCTDSHYKKVADPCWPDRYSAESRKLTVAAFEPQVMNGHILDLTIWNQHFEPGTDKINAAGLDKLDQLARRRPQPDGRIYLQTARDIAYNAEKAADYATTQADLNAKRVAAVQKYLNASLTGRNLSIDIQVHDPAPAGADGSSPKPRIPILMPATGAGLQGTQPGAAPPQATNSGGSGNSGSPASTPTTGGVNPRP